MDVFLELSCFFHDPANVGNLISGSSAFSKTSLIVVSYDPLYFCVVCCDLSIFISNFIDLIFLPLFLDESGYVVPLLLLIFTV